MMSLTRHQKLMLFTAGLLVFLTFVDVDSLKIPFLQNPELEGEDEDEEDSDYEVEGDEA